jgi:hypothetical protein
MIFHKSKTNSFFLLSLLTLCQQFFKFTAVEAGRQKVGAYHVAGFWSQTLSLLLCEIESAALLVQFFGILLMFHLLS